MNRKSQCWTINELTNSNLSFINLGGHGGYSSGGYSSGGYGGNYGGGYGGGYSSYSAPGKIE